MQKRLLRQTLTVAQRFRVGTYAVVAPSKFIQNNKIYVSTNTVSVGIRCFSTINSNNGNTNVTPVVAVFTKGSKDIKKSKLSLYADLTKFRLSSLVVVTSGAGFLCGGAPVDWTMMAATCVGTGLCAASAGSFNQIIERHQDAAMNRTKQRPLPSGQLSVSEASAVGVTAGVAGTALLYGLTNPVVAALGAFNVFLYAGPYTYSKRYTEWNTWIGSLVGAVPPVMGYAAATGGVVMAGEPLALASLLFLWQFPHFFALSWLHREDYARGNFAMIGVNDPHGTRSADLIWEYSLFLAAVPVLCSASGLTSWMFAVEGTMANLYMLSLAHAFRQDSSNAKARKVFLCSLWLLPVLLGTFVFHSRVWAEEKIEQQSLMVLTNGEDTLDDQSVLHGTPLNASQPVGVIAALRKQLRAICMHEWIAQYNTTTSTDNNNNNDNKAKEDTNTGTHLCMKLKADKVIENASSATSTLAAAVVDATTLNSVNSLSPTATPIASQISQSNLTDPSQISHSKYPVSPIPTVSQISQSSTTDSDSSK